MTTESVTTTFHRHELSKEIEKGNRMKVFQIGAAGGVGQRVMQRLVARGNASTGMHRGPEQAQKILDCGGNPVRGDLITDSVDELASMMTDHDAVVFSAGAHGTGQEKTTLIDGKGLEKAADAAVKAGVRRFVLVSAFPESERSAGLGEGFEHYMRVKKSADVYLSRTGLDWVIVRPGLLRDEPGDDLVTAGLAVEYGSVRRDNVASFIDGLLQEPALKRTIVELTDGLTPVTAAVAGLMPAGTQG